VKVALVPLVRLFLWAIGICRMVIS